ncbi:DUF4214 domain-containing protein [Undibacterium umbellatum]|uniref:DUF4214 domain-containing protein n=1 Tax=Undibacterium umbellatum TaxID=2762300 RepID=A0ABR6ZAT2_9BURK|nr:DUF4214 domain-containing protein [Undibacterium umbellatum]MBC3908854.1 DUF4214 domain-containing protein [Undibacterium umbellatum]
MATVVGDDGNNTWTVINPSTFTLDGKGGIDTLNLGTSLRSSYTITKAADGSIHVDTLSGASGELHATLLNMERLVFNNGQDTVDLLSFFGDTTAPVVISFSPATLAGSVATSSDIVLTFSEPVKAGSGTISLQNADGSTVASYNIAQSNNVTISGNTVTINPTNDLNNNSTYKLNIPSGAIKDIAGNNYIGTSSYSFTTAIKAVPGGIIGTAGNDSLSGTAANDSFNGLAGNDIINGGAGLDIAIYAGKRSDFNISPSGANFTVQDKTGAEGTDTVNQLERLQFADMSVALDINSTAGVAYRIYQAAFNRTPDLPGLGYWIGQMDKGSTLNQVAASFVISAEFKQLYGANISDNAFLTALYSNVLHRAPDQAGFDYWNGQVSKGMTRADILASFSESAENQVQVIAKIQNGIDFIPFG